jgi:hypothetical protein
MPQPSQLLHLPACVPGAEREPETREVTEQKGRGERKKPTIWLRVGRGWAWGSPWQVSEHQWKEGWEMGQVWLTVLSCPNTLDWTGHSFLCAARGQNPVRANVNFLSCSNDSLMYLFVFSKLVKSG